STIPPPRPASRTYNSGRSTPPASPRRAPSRRRRAASSSRCASEPPHEACADEVRARSGGHESERDGFLLGLVLVTRLGRLLRARLGEEHDACHRGHEAHGDEYLGQPREQLASIGGVLQRLGAVTGVGTGGETLAIEIADRA